MNICKPLIAYLMLRKEKRIVYIFATGTRMYVITSTCSVVDCYVLLQGKLHRIKLSYKLHRILFKDWYKDDDVIIFTHLQTQRLLNYCA